MAMQAAAVGVYLGYHAIVAAAEWHGRTPESPEYYARRGELKRLQKKIERLDIRFAKGRLHDGVFCCSHGHGHVDSAPCTDNLDA